MKSRQPYLPPQVDVCTLLRRRLCQTSDAEIEDPDNPMPWGDN